MRQDSESFSAQNAAATKEPRFVVGILFDVGSLYLTSHGDITGIPGTVFNDVLAGQSALSQRLNPDQGRSEIGSISFDALDLSGALTAAFNAKLAAGQGLRGRTVKLWHGFKGDAFSSLQLFQTQTISDVALDGSTYSFECEDVTRSQRKEIFEPKKTTLRLSCTATETTIYVADTSEFSLVYHGPAYTDAPNQIVGYFQLEDEWIRYTGKTPDAFTGCTRGVLNSRARAHSADQTATQDRRTKVEELIYLEGPAVQIAYAINTGIIYGTAYTLPAHWQLGISASLLRTTDWTGIGPDLWDVADETRGLVVRFLKPKKTDGKAFLETQIYLLCGIFSPVYSDGALGLKRSAAILRGAAPVAVLSESNVVSVGTLRQDMRAMRNRFLIAWSWDGKDYRLESAWEDGNSIAAHKASDLLELKFQGLVGSRHTDVTIRQRLTQLGDRFSAPPWRLTLTVFGSLNRLEVGDVVRVKLATVRDFAGNVTTLDRAFEVQRVSVDYITGDVQLELFGSTAKPTETPLEFSGLPALPDTYYTQAGQNLASLLTISGSGVVSGGPYTLAGGADMNASGAVFYYAGDLTIGAGVTVNISGNVRLRVRGFLQNNGTILGDGGGLAGVVDSGDPATFPDGVPGYVGSSRGRDGIEVSQESGNPVMRTIAAKSARGQNAVFPYLALTVDGLTVRGVPTDLRGGSGAPGGKVRYQVTAQRAAGGTGGSGGAGLIIESRGFACGAAGSIRLNGTDGVAGAFYDDAGKRWHAGGGGGGAPGSLLVLLDGNGISVPDLAGKFFATCGAVPTAAPYEGKLKYLEQTGDQRYSLNDRNFAGFDDPSVISALDLSDACLRIQYIPYPVPPNDVRDDPPPPPTGYTVQSGPGYILARFTPPEAAGISTEIWASPDSTLSNATLVGEATGTQFYHALTAPVQRFYFFRTKKIVDENAVVFSEFVPGATSIITSTAGSVIASDIPETDAFLERFEDVDVLSRFDSAYGTGSITTPVGSGTFGGRVLQVAGGSRALIYSRNIPIDPLGLYRLTAKVRQTVAPTDSTRDNVWVGFRGIAADGVSGTTDHYPAAANLDLGVSILGNWVTVVGYFSGAVGTVLQPAPSENNPSRVSAGTVYIRPIIWANYFDGNGTQQFDYLRIERLVAGRWVDIIGDGKPSDYADNTAQQAPTTSGVFFDGFEHQNYPLYYNVRALAAGAVITYPQTGQNGGRALSASGLAWLAWKQNVPFDPAAWYRITARLRRTVASTTGNEGVYIGIEGVAADGSTLINVLGSNDYTNQHYLAAQNQNLGATGLGVWVDVVGYFKGNGTPVVAPSNSINTPSPLYTGVAYFRPLLILNYNGGNGTQEIDYLRVERLTSLGTALIDPASVTEVYSATATGVNVFTTVTSSPPNTLVASVAVPAQPFATEMIVTATGAIDHYAPSAQFSTQADIADFSASNIYGEPVARNASTAAPDARNSFAIEKRYTVPANTAKTFYLYGISGAVGSVPGAFANFNSVLLKVEVIKR